MRKAAAVSLAIGAALWSGTGGLACGDKLLVLGRGVRFQYVFSSHQTNVLIYYRATSGAVLRNAKLQTTLRQAGVKLRTADGPTQLTDALQSAKVDVVLAELGDLGGITQQLQSASSRPVVVPLLLQPSKAEFTAAQREYRVALKASADPIQYLAAIAEAVKPRSGMTPKS